MRMGDDLAKRLAVNACSRRYSRAVQSSSAEDAALLTFWLQTGQAMVAIVEAKPRLMGQ
jgi:hypothetical protein